MEHTKQIIAWELLLVFVFSSLLLIQSAEENNLAVITGRAVASPTKSSVLAEIENAIPKADFLDDISDMSACLIVSMSSTTKYSYELVKVDGVAAVTESSSEMCKGVQNEDFIVRYISYDALKSHLENPNFNRMKLEADGTYLFVYPSKYIEQGMTISDPAEFKQKFGALLNNYFTQQEIKTMLSPKTAEEREPSSVMSYLFYFIIGTVVAVVLIIGFILTQSKKPEIKENLELAAYIKSSLAQGYQEEQVRQALLQSGWNPKSVDDAFKSMNSANSAAPAQKQQNIGIA
ncbi:hypothetical protein JXB27_03485 [Candidatus Woesearchaeota archaeon]|nr:hypothetical protein [Candidatus Woesearchaeota archaeon]